MLEPWGHINKVYQEFFLKIIEKRFEPSYLFLVMLEFACRKHFFYNFMYLFGKLQPLLCQKQFIETQSRHFILNKEVKKIKNFKSKI